MKKQFTILSGTFILCALFTLVIFLFTPCVKAQPGSPDLTFNANDTGAVSLGFFRSSSLVSNIRTIIRLQSGKYLVGGDHIIYNRHPTSGISLLTANGEVDQSFTTGSGFQQQTGPSTFTNGIIYKLLELPDGKILVGGQFNLYRGQPAGGLIRLLPNGDPDPTFVTGSGANNIVRSFLPMADGRILVGGDFTAYDGTAFGRLVMLQANGQIDATFNVDGVGANNSIFAMDTLSNGEIIIGGSFTNFNETSKSRLGKLEKNGTLIASFPSVQVPNNTVSSIIIEDDDKIMLGGVFSIVAGAGGSIRRILGNGNADPSFTAVVTAGSTTETLIPYGENHYFAGGQFTFYDGENVDKFVLIKKSDGKRETNFNNIGIKSTGNILAAASNFPQGIVVGGTFSIVSSALTGNIFKLTNAGFLDGSFNAGHGIYAGTFGSISPTSSAARVLRIVKQPDGKVLVAGQFSRYFDKVSRCIVRLNPDGSFDESFQAGLPGADHEILDADLQPDGKIVIVGRFSGINGTRRDRLARLNTDGSVDESFKPDNWLPTSTSTLNAVAVAPNGNIYVGGVFSSYFTSGTFSTNYKRLIRLLPTGELDETFVSVNITAGTINTLLVQGNEKIIAGGSGLGIENSGARGNVLRFNNNGSIDNSFNNGQQTVPSSTIVERIKFNTDSSKLMIAGNFSTYGGIATSGLTLTDLNGFKDINFQRTSLNYVRDMEMLPDGRILAVGNVQVSTSPGSLSFSNQPAVARVSAEGIFDTAWAQGGYSARRVIGNTNESAVSTLFACAFMGNRLLIGGNFMRYGEVTRTGLAAINIGETTTPVTWKSFETTTKAQNAILQWSTASEQNNKGFSVERSTNGDTFTSIGFVAAAGDGNNASPQHYFFTDYQPGVNTFYYRLKQIDIDGIFSYSAIKKVVFSELNNIRFWPNPLVTESLLQIPMNTFTRYQIIDLNGRIVREENFSASQTNVRIQRNQLGAGIYMLKLVDNNDVTSHFIKFNVQ